MAYSSTFLVRPACSTSPADTISILSLGPVPLPASHRPSFSSTHSSARAYCWPTTLLPGTTVCRPNSLLQGTLDADTAHALRFILVRDLKCICFALGARDLSFAILPKVDVLNIDARIIQQYITWSHSSDTRLFVLYGSISVRQRPCSSRETPRTS